MNTNDLPPAAKLAALIEAGMAAHPEIAHSHEMLAVVRFDVKADVCHIKRGCALCYAALGAGATADEVGKEQYHAVYKRLRAFPIALLNEVETANFKQDIQTTIRSLREGALARFATTATA